MEAVRTKDENKERTFANAIDAKRSMLECMRNMGTMAAYSFGASFLLKKHPPIAGSAVLPIVIGALLFGLTIAGSIWSAELLVDGIIKRYVDPHHPRWQTHAGRLIIIVPIMAVFLALASTPAIIVFELPR
ncbi:hypothetical protein RKE25_09910 [Dyella sp. BiH032]|uniref:hypothetical protein n=1 Tax=Dyella sp. BiH032 TaxID=3075430 RepID=UPI00289341D9|nr:hypothetical protein [Dyella sp. BiH032]WNL47914.1 hypothetical protein RKE25_09910 [Dyella sp. BiH032]